MGTVQESLPDKDGAGEPKGLAPANPSRTRQSLPPKGSCWYCDKPIDSVRRFCGKECADAFDEEQAYSRT